MGAFSADFVTSLVEVFPQKICLALGMICYSLVSIGHTAVTGIYDKLVQSWTTTLIEEETSPLVKVSILNGLLAIIGSERTLISTPSSTRSSSNDPSTSEIVKMASKIVATSNDIGIQGNTAWMLGHLYLSACAVTETRASVPPNYSYLNDICVLRSSVDFIIEAGKHGPEKMKNEELKIVLNSLQDEVSRALPPLNWAGVLSPLMRMEYDSDIKYLCMKLAVNECISAPTAASFISSWLQPNLFMSLSDECKIILYTSMSIILKPVQTSVLKIFLDKCCLVPFTSQPINTEHCIAVLDGLNQALLVQDPPKAVTSLLYQATENFYKSIKNCVHEELLSRMSECLASIPDEMFDTMTTDDLADPGTFVKGVFIRCKLVSMGRQPIAMLNSCLDATINNKDCAYIPVFRILCQCFYDTIESTNESDGMMNLLRWLLELIGHIRNISIGVIKLDESAFPLPVVLEYMIGIVAAAVSFWTTRSIACMLLLDAGTEIGAVEATTVTINRCLESLPVTIKNLRLEPWLQILPKIINWMLAIIQLPEHTVTSVVKKSVKESLYLLRDCEEFKKASVWTEVFSVTA